jgi:hypothetical protein
LSLNRVHAAVAVLVASVAATALVGSPAVAAPSKQLPVPAKAECVTDKLLIPSCGVLWGAAAGGFSDAPRDEALKAWEKTSGRTAAIFHQYHKGDEIFPTKAEIAMTRDPNHPRVLLLNWKIAYGSTWAKVAAGAQDARIDAFAARIKAGYSEKFFLALNHEPENDVIARAGSGWTAKDFAAMYRHTILRLRAQGITNAINVLAYMGNEKWMSQSWWADLYPGDDVVDWIGLVGRLPPHQQHRRQVRRLQQRPTRTGQTPRHQSFGVLRLPRRRRRRPQHQHRQHQNRPGRVPHPRREPPVQRHHPLTTQHHPPTVMRRPENPSRAAHHTATTGQPDRPMPVPADCYAAACDHGVTGRSRAMPSTTRSTRSLKKHTRSRIFGFSGIGSG